MVDHKQAFVIFLNWFEMHLQSYGWELYKIHYLPIRCIQFVRHKSLQRRVA